MTGDLTTTTDVVVAPEDDAEIRRLTLYNEGAEARTLDVVSYAEVVLGAAAADQMHPAFANLFVETEALAGGAVLLATRRPRVDSDARLWAAHVLQVSTPPVAPMRYETDRSRFIGRGRTLRNAACLAEGGALGNSADSTLDPIFSLQCRVRVAPGERVQLSVHDARRPRPATRPLRSPRSTAIRVLSTVNRPRPGRSRARSSTTCASSSPRHARSSRSPDT